MPALADERGRLVPSRSPLAGYYSSLPVKRTSSTPGNVSRAARRATMPKAFSDFLKENPIRSPSKITVTAKTTAAAQEDNNAEDATRADAHTPIPDADHEDDDEIMAQLEFNDAVAEQEKEIELEVLSGDEMMDEMERLRDYTGVGSNLPSKKIAEFARKLWSQISPADCSPKDLEVRARFLNRGEAGEGVTPLRSMLLGTKVTPGRASAQTVGTGRRSKLFGSQPPELHQRVLGVLNKVTTDEDKYREIKHELMRLPLPEANTETMKKVVTTFFDKAVREQRFSSLYAELVAEICRVPTGQTQTGDVKRSLGYRFRVALIGQCQEEFEKPFVLTEQEKLADDGVTPLDADEIERRYISKKKRVTGNVKFVGELYLRQIVSSSIIRLIMMQLLTGTSDERVLEGPPDENARVPEDYELEMLLTLLRTCGQHFIRSKHCDALNLVMPRVVYHSQHHPTLRVRYLMLDCLDLADRNFRPKQSELSKMTPEERRRQLILDQMYKEDGSPPSKYGKKEAPSTSSGKGGKDQAEGGERLGMGSAVAGPSSRTPVAPPPPIAQSPIPGTSPVARDGPGPMSRNDGRSVATRLDMGEGTPQPSGAKMGKNGKKTPVPQEQQLVAAPPVNNGHFPPLPPPDAKYQPTTDKIQTLMTILLDTNDYLGTAMYIRDAFIDPMETLRHWVHRAVSMVKLEKERRQVGGLLHAALDIGIAADGGRGAFMNMCRHMIVETIDERYFEEVPNVWKYWAQIVAGDPESFVLHQGLHNFALQNLLQSGYATDETISKLIVDVATVNSNVDPWFFGHVGCGFARFRYLAILVAHNHSLGEGRKPGWEMSLLTKPKQRKADIEIDMFCLVQEGKVGELFELLRTHSRVLDPAVPQKVISALLCAGAARDCGFISDAIDVLSLVVDGVDRAERELSILMEAYFSSADYYGRYQTQSAGYNTTAKLKSAAVVSAESIQLAAMHVSQGGDDPTPYLGASVARPLALK